MSKLDVATRLWKGPRHMKLHNQTSHAADILRSVSPRAEDHMLCCLIVRRTFRLQQGELKPTPDEPWSIEQAPTETELGVMPGDKGVYSGGVDVLIGGTVRQPNGQAAPRLDVALEVGRSFHRRIAVLGERSWQRNDEGELVMSEPAPFKSMELSYANAFGGVVDTDYGVPMPYSANPLGKGFYLSAESAVGQPLPNLEDPAHLIETANDFPDPIGCGYYPMTGGLRAAAALDHPEAEAIAKRTMSPQQRPDPSPGSGDALNPEQVKPTLFNMAHPNMIIEPSKAPESGDRVRLSHGLRDGDLEFLLPEIAAHAHVQLENRDYVFPLHLDQIGLVAGKGRVMLSQRCVFEYRLVKQERRFVTLYDGPAPDPIPTSYRHELKTHWEHSWEDPAATD